ncbi:hypothetical protein LG302_00810 [Halomonas organivorans]
MKLLCKIFGHQPPVYAKKGWWSPGQEYGRLHSGITDGIGREHGHVTAKCARCKEEFKVARVHLIPTAKEKALARELETIRNPTPYAREKRILANWIDKNANQPHFWNHHIARQYADKLRREADAEEGGDS